MFCSKCGTFLEGNPSFCHECGAKTEQVTPAAPVQQETGYQPPIQSQPVQPQQGQSDFQPQQPADFNYPPQNGAGYQQQYYPPEQNPLTQNQPELPMKWYKFTIYFALFAGVAMNIISALMAFTGANYTMYDLDPELVYWYYDGLQALDMCYAVILIALAVFGIYVRQSLAKFKKNGPMLMYALGIASTAISAIYQIGSTVIIGDDISTVISTVIGSIIGTAVVLYCEIKYFTKRQHLFVN